MFELGQSQIGDQGVQYLAKALQQNKVTWSTTVSLFNHLLIIVYRLSLGLASLRIKSVIKEYSI
jgi:hypothetical protein